MYSCIICQQNFNTKKALVKHFSTCWKKNNPSHKSKEAHRSEDIEKRKVSNDIMNFFILINEEKK